jgi:hypothetical protein
MVFKVHCLSFLKQKILIKIAISCFIILKFKVLIKILFFKHAGSYFCLTFLYVQCVFVKYILLIYFSVLRYIKQKTPLWYILLTLKGKYNKYFIASILAIVLIFFDFIFIIFKSKI